MKHSLALSPPLEDRRPEAVNLAEVGTALKRRWRWIAWPALAAFAASFAFVNVVTPRYTGESRLILEARDSYYTRPNQDRTEQAPLIDEQAVASQVQVVMSRDLAREAIRRLNLVGNPEFDPLVGGVGPLTRAAVFLGLAPNPLDRPPEDRVLEKYYERLLVYAVGKSRILAVEFRSKDPELAASAANAVAELYLSFQETAKKDMARSASTWLGTNIEGLRARLAEAEAKVEEFRARSGLLTGTNNAPIASQQLSELSTQLAQARTAQADSQAKAKLIRDLIKAGRTFEIPDVANNELIRRLIEQRITLKAQAALEARTYLAEHPRIKELNAQLADLEGQIRGAAERVSRTLENDARIAGSRVESLQAAIDAQRGVVNIANENEVQLRALEREARAQRDQLEAYLGRYREATARDAENAVPPDARIVSRAVVPQIPSFPKKLPIVLLTTLAAIVLGAAAVVAAELLGAGPRPAVRPADDPAAPAHADEDDRVRQASADAVARALGVGPAAGVPEEASAAAVAKARLAAQDPEPPVVPAEVVPPAEEAEPPVPATLADVAEEIERLAPAASLAPAADPTRFDFAPLIARLSAGGGLGRGRRVLVTGLGRSETALLMAAELGRRLSENARVLFVLADPAAGSAAEARPGFTDLVAGEARFLDVIRREADSAMHVVPAGSLDGRVLAAEGQGIDVALSAFDQTYDWVVCGLCDGADEDLRRLLAGRVDAVVIASDADPEDPALVALYDDARAAGAPDVIVAREEALAWTRAAAA